MMKVSLTIVFLLLVDGFFFVTNPNPFLQKNSTEKLRSNTAKQEVNFLNTLQEIAEDYKLLGHIAKQKISSLQNKGHRKPSSFTKNTDKEPLYDSKLLKTKDYEQMRNLLKKHITKSQKNISNDKEDIESALSPLKKGLKILLMRPDTDSINSSLMLNLQNEIMKYRSFMAVFQEIIEKTLSNFKSKKGSVAYQVSQLYAIENALSYLQPINNKESTAILKKIKAANLKISKKVFNYLLLEMGRGKTASPSYLAGRILKKRQDKEKELKQAEKSQKERKKQSKKKKEK